ncbi:hypothetical protein OH492_26325 [Vibrio chagasii]|nr:hypothetical protein [Vibrio chagasii]
MIPPWPDAHTSVDECSPYADSSEGDDNTILLSATMSCTYEKVDQATVVTRKTLLLAQALGSVTV